MTLPDFLILGAMKGGTTSMYDYLTKHPNVLASSLKEVHFFDIRFDRGVDWYEICFPPKKEIGFLTGEATPYYLFHPLVPARVFEIIPHAKFIVLLRNPVDRAFSHYHHKVRVGRESRSFEEAIRDEKKQFEAENELVLKGLYSVFHHQHTYLSRGIYVDQLQRWFKLFPREQFKIIKSEDFFSAPKQVFEDVLGFLGLPLIVPDHLAQQNKGDYTEMYSKTRVELKQFFASHNEKLYSLLKVNFDWK